jgi:hypothetical protein
MVIAIGAIWSPALRGATFGGCLPAFIATQSGKSSESITQAKQKKGDLNATDSIGAVDRPDRGLFEPS